MSERTRIRLLVLLIGYCADGAMIQSGFPGTLPSRPETNKNSSKLPPLAPSDSEGDGDEDEEGSSSSEFDDVLEHPELKVPLQTSLKPPPPPPPAPSQKPHETKKIQKDEPQMTEEDSPSQPLRTLKKLQAMLDETDYITSAPQHHGAAPIRKELGVVSHRDQPRKPRFESIKEPANKLWTSKDRGKYKRQQRKAQINQQQHQSDGETTDDDGLGYTLPDLPVYMSDGEESTDFEPEEGEEKLFHQDAANQMMWQRAGNQQTPPPPPPPFPPNWPYASYNPPQNHDGTQGRQQHSQQQYYPPHQQQRQPPQQQYPPPPPPLPQQLHQHHQQQQQPPNHPHHPPQQYQTLQQYQQQQQYLQQQQQQQPYSQMPYNNYSPYQTAPPPPAYPSYHQQQEYAARYPGWASNANARSAGYYTSPPPPAYPGYGPYSYTPQIPRKRERQNLHNRVAPLQRRDASPRHSERRIEQIRSDTTQQPGKTTVQQPPRIDPTPVAHPPLAAASYVGSPLSEKATTLVEASTMMTFDSLRKLALVVTGVMLLSYCAVAPRNLHLVDYNARFYENLRTISLSVIAPIAIFLGVYDARENDVNAVIHTFFTSFTIGYLIAFVSEVAWTTLCRLGAFIIWEPAVFKLSPRVPSIVLPWVLRENQYRPKRITLFAADFASSCVASPIVEELVKLKVVQWTVRLPRNFKTVTKQSIKKGRKKTRKVVEAIPRGPGEPEVTNANSYVTQLLVAGIGLKMCDSIRRILMYTKKDDLNKSFYAFFRGVFPIHELCGTMTALALAKRDMLGVRMPMWKMLLPAVFIHGMANFRGKKPVYKWNSSSPWSEMQLSPWSVADASTFSQIASKGFAKLMWLIILFRVLGYCVKNYYLIKRQAIKRTTTYAGNHAAFSAELAAAEMIFSKFHKTRLMF